MRQSAWGRGSHNLGHRRGCPPLCRTKETEGGGCGDAAPGRRGPGRGLPLPGVGAQTRSVTALHPAVPGRAGAAPLHRGKALGRRQECRPVACHLREASADGSEAVTGLPPPFRKVTTSVTPNSKSLSRRPGPYKRNRSLSPSALPAPFLRQRRKGVPSGEPRLTMSQKRNWAPKSAEERSRSR